MQHGIAIAEDEPDLRAAVAEYLRGYGYVVIEAADAAAFRAAVAGNAIDVALLDIVMPGEDGLSLARWLRGSGGPGIILATAQGRTVDRIVGLELGADDYIVKPCDLRELLARIRSVLRRREGAGPPAVAAAAPAPVRVGACRIDPGSGRLEHPVSGGIDLSAAECARLVLLARRAGRVVSRADVIAACGIDSGGGNGERLVDVRVARLRQRLRELGPDAPTIETIRGEGYMLSP